MSSLPVPQPPHQCRLPVAAPVRIFERAAVTLRLRTPLQAKARRYAIPLEIIAFRTAMRDDPGLLARFDAEIRAATEDSPLATGDLNNALLAVVEEGAEGDLARTYVLMDQSAASLRRVIREAQEEQGALSILIAEAEGALARQSTPAARTA